MEMQKQRQREQAMNEKIKKLQSFADESGVSVRWEWKNDENQWRPFDDSLMQQLNDIQVGNRSMLFIKGQQYQVTRTSKDGAMQTNTQSGANRECRRRIVVAQQISWEWQENNGKWIQYSDNIAKKK
eukprot:57214_1